MVKGSITLKQIYDCFTISNSKNKVKHIKEVVYDNNGNKQVYERTINFTKQILHENNGTFYFVSDLSEYEIKKYFEIVFGEHNIVEINLEKLRNDNGT